MVGRTVAATPNARSEAMIAARRAAAEGCVRDAAERGRRATAAQDRAARVGVMADELRRSAG